MYVVQNLLYDDGYEYFFEDEDVAKKYMEFRNKNLSKGELEFVCNPLEPSEVDYNNVKHTVILDRELNEKYISLRDFGLKRNYEINDEEIVRLMLNYDFVTQNIYHYNGMDFLVSVNGCMTNDDAIIKARKLAREYVKSDRYEKDFSVGFKDFGNNRLTCENQEDVKPMTKEERNEF